MVDYTCDLLAQQGLVSELEEEYLRQSDVLGDNFRDLAINRATAELFDSTMDQVFGTTTFTSTPPIFGDPDDWQSESAIPSPENCENWPGN